jgi:hypothetical protein
VTNFAGEDAHVKVQVKGANSHKLKISNAESDNAPAPSKKGNGFIWNGTLSPALPPEIEGISSPGDGYLGLQGIFGPAAGDTTYGDETIASYSGFAAPLLYGGEEYDSLTVDSNGYVILGDAATSENNNCCDPAMPDTAPPNNVLAPYWTDLNPEEGGAIFVGELDFGGGDVFLVVEWRMVPVFETNGTPFDQPRTFQVWIAENTTAEHITYEYCNAPNANAYPNDGCSDTTVGLVGPGAGDGLVVGAENRDGTSAATIGPEDTQPSNLGYTVDAGSPTAGGTNSISYTVKATGVGTNSIKAWMDSDVTPSTAKIWTKFHVTP